ncbi:phosphonate metabolism transcriptional regulator PhnF [Plastorhodobacter daqingensis]|uniref:Phosphonate metabolism transcriptional regulator PhnF n=1 Tax=Plastorhodobacter daqingensis TaxID=1387281 RepID=A0ABW2UK24_9RHOB
MTRTPLWTAIADTLRRELAAGLYPPGAKLPTEAALAARFGVNRHTLRHALSVLAQEGLVHSRRGAGVFAAARPVEYPLGRRVRFHQNLRAAGQIPQRALLRLETRPADAEEARALRMEPGAQVHVYEGVSLADGLPLAHFLSIFPAARFPALPERLRQTSSVTAALLAEGLADYTRAETRLTAVPAGPVQALHLRLREGAPLLRSRALNVDTAGQPVEYGETHYAGERLTLVVSADDPSVSP